MAHITQTTINGHTVKLTECPFSGDWGSDCEYTLTVRGPGYRGKWQLGNSHKLASQAYLIALRHVSAQQVETQRRITRMNASAARATDPIA